MRRRYLVIALIAAAVGTALLRVAATTVLGQDAQAVNVVSAAPDVPLYNPFLPESAPPPRHADGHPDLNGVWDYATATPLQRPSEFGDNLFLAAEEAGAFHQSRQWHDDEQGSNVEHDAYSVGMNSAWFNYDAALLQNRTSLIVDPPDGQVPPLTPTAQERMVRCTGIGQCGAQMLAPRDSQYQADETIADHITDRSFSERCLVVRSGPPIESTAWNNNMHIFHRKDVVVIHTEMIHTARVVWLDGRPRPDPSVKWWHGYSQGRWEGDTLIIETTNFRPDARWLGVLNPETFTLVERLTRIGEDTVMYEYTMNHPDTWTRPWTVQLPMRRQNGLMYEYACHEGNYGVKFQLMAARSRDR